MANLNTRIKVILETKGAEGSIKNLKKEMRAWRRELNEAEVGTKEYNAALAKVQDGNKILREHRQAARGLADGYSKALGPLKALGAAAVASFTVDAIVGYGKALFNTATELEALQGKAQIVFAETLPAVTAAANENATAMGLTTNEYIKAAAGIQDLLVPMGFQRAEAANISTEMVNLSGALSEWTGGQRSATEVAEILQKAVLGEREQLKGLGISIQEADVKARLAEKGLSGLSGEMLQQAKAAATLELIMEKSTDAQAAFAEGAGSLGRSVSQISAAFREIKERIATSLTPVFGRLAKTLTKLVLPAQKSMTEQLRDQQSEMNLEFEILKKSNFSQEERARHINDINTKYKQYIPNLISEKDSLEDITKIQEKANNLMEQRILFIAFEKEIKEIQEESAAALETAFQAEKRRITVEKQLKDGQIQDNARYAESLEGIALFNAALRDDQLEFASGTAERVKDTESVYDGFALRLKTSLAEIKKAFGSTFNTEIAAPDGGKNGENTAAKKAREVEAVAVLLSDQELNRLRLAEEGQFLIDKRVLNQSNADIDSAQRAAIAERIRLELLTDREAELEDIQLHYAELLSAAEIYGIDTAALKEQEAAKLAEIEQKYRDADVKATEDAQARKIAAYGAFFKGAGDVIGAFADLIGSEGEKAAAFQKVATLAKIAFDTAAAISSLVAYSAANPGNILTGGAAGIATYAAGLVRILSNMAQARKIIAGAPKVEQRYTGGFTNVTGADDGRQYRAQYIGRPGTGMLNHANPVVLANERGPEYFVSNKSLKNPAVLNHVRAIENIQRSRRPVPQFQEGGFSNQTGGQAQSAQSFDVQRSNMMMAELIRILSGGVVAVIEDTTVRDIQSRYNKLNAASGGVL